MCVHVFLSIVLLSLCTVVFYNCPYVYNEFEKAKTLIYFTFNIKIHDCSITHYTSTCKNNGTCVYVTVFTSEVMEGGFEEKPQQLKSRKKKVAKHNYQQFLPMQCIFHDWSFKPFHKLTNNYYLYYIALACMSRG